MSAKSQDRRREKRKEGQGDLTLRVAGATPAQMRATLLDASESGFRASHGNLTLTGNQEVSFRMPGASGKARVVWNRILGGVVETGFAITKRD